MTAVPMILLKCNFSATDQQQNPAVVTFAGFQAHYITRRRLDEDRTSVGGINDDAK
jgi:hypothetical protein